jgi:hypothetical protein
VKLFIALVAVAFVLYLPVRAFAATLLTQAALTWVTTSRAPDAPFISITTQRTE